MRLSAKTALERSKPEPTIALINIVFLMLIFFLIAGSLAPPLDRDLTLVSAAELEGREPPDALVAHPDGTLTYRRKTIDAAAYVAQAVQAGGEGSVRVVPDRDLPAARLIDLGHELRAAGATSVFIVTERALQ